jgi:hypothetical protein
VGAGADVAGRDGDSWSGPPEIAVGCSCRARIPRRGRRKAAAKLAGRRTDALRTVSRFPYGPLFQLREIAHALTLVRPTPPRCRVVERPAHEGSVAVAGQRDGEALLGKGPNRAGADQLAALLGPDPAAAGVDPRRPVVIVVAKPAHDGGVAVGGQRDGLALDGGSHRAGADQLASLLGPQSGASMLMPLGDAPVPRDMAANAQKAKAIAQRDHYQAGRARG